MKKVYAQGAIFRFMNVLSILVAIFAIVFGIAFNDSEVWKLLFVSLFYTSLSLLLLINRIQYDDQLLYIVFATKKKTIPYSDIKEVYYINNRIKGCEVVLNLEKAIDFSCNSSFLYIKECKEMGITNTFNFAGMRLKDLHKILKIYKGKIVSSIDQLSPNN